MNQNDFEKVLRSLHPKQLQVLEYFLAGYKDKDIAKKMYITSATIRKHIGEICGSFGLKNEPGERYSLRDDLKQVFRRFKCDNFGGYTLKLVDDALDDNELNGHPLETDTGKSKEELQDWTTGHRCNKVWGRNTLIQKILSRLYDLQEQPILYLSGSAGYGKTEVARVLAEIARRENFFSGVLWVTARHSELIDDEIGDENHIEALDWRDFINQIAQKMDCSVGRVERRLKEERWLIILDNAETSRIKNILANLIKVLNPSRALLTSRFEVNCQFVRLIPIEGIEEYWSYCLLKDEANFRNIHALLKADDSQLKRVHELSDGAPLALHFIIGRVQDDKTLEPVLSALEKASGDVEVFYKFSLETSWQRISELAKNILRYMGQADAGILWSEIHERFLAKGVDDAQLVNARLALQKWYLIEGKENEINNDIRYDLHPWVRRSLRANLVDNWKPSFEDLKETIMWRYK